ncbi:MAG: AMP-binding protein [Antricoccus sp.]
MPEIETLRTQADLVSRARRMHPSRLAYRDRNQSITWAECDAAVGRIAARLSAMDLGAGDRIVIALSNQIPFVLTYFAALRAGLIAVPTSPESASRELAHVLNDSGAAAMIGTDRPADNEVTFIEVADLLTAGFDQSAPSIGQAAVGIDDVSTLFYTNGTTGTPKGAMLTHRNLLANRQQIALLPQALEAQDLLYIGVPGYHIYGLGPGICQVAWAASAALLDDHFAPVDSLEMIADQRVTAILAVPQMYDAWSDCSAERQQRAFEGVRIGMSGAAPLPGATLEALASKGLAVWEGYGLTETSPVVTSTLVGGLAKPGSVGRPIPGVDVQLRRIDNSIIEVDEPTALDEVNFDVDGAAHDGGEIYVRGASVFAGYWPDRRDGAGAGGWFGTSDVAYRDDDGDLFLIDRIGDLIIVSGFNVYPSEVESVMRTADGVAEAAVIGVPSERTGEAVSAFVVPQVVDGVDGVDHAQLLESIGAHCRHELARYKRPTTIEIVQQLPHTATGKVRRTVLRESR